MMGRASSRKLGLPLRYVLPAVVLSLSLAIVAFATATELLDSRSRAVDRARDDLASTKSFVSNDLEAALRHDDPGKLRSTVQSISRDRDIATALVVDPAGQIVMATDYRLEGLSLDETRFAPWWAAAQQASSRNVTQQVERLDERRMLDISPLGWKVMPGELLASRRGVLVIEYDLGRTFGVAASDVQRRFLQLMAIVIGATAAVVWLLNRVLIRRIDALANFARGGLSGASPPPRGGALVDEISQISRALEDAVDEARRRLLALQISEQRFRNILEGTSDWVFETNAEGSISFSNRGCETVLGLKVEEVLQRPVSSFFGEEQADFLPPRCGDGRRELEEMALMSPEGRQRYVRLTLQPGGGNGRPTVFHGVCTDITERRRLQQMQRQSQKLELVGQLAGGVAHDFNNLVAVMLGHCELLLLDGTLDTDQQQSVEEILECCQRAAELTRRLLAFGRRQVVEPKVVDLRDVMIDAGRLLRRLVGTTTRVVSSPGDDPLYVSADPAQLEQVIVNLVINARDAMPNGGTVGLTCRREIDPVGGQAMALLTVQDQGSGMAPETLERVFEPFFTTKPSGKGTGLGLSTALGIVEHAGGRITVSSKLGRGSRFEVLLPLTVEVVEGLAIAGSGGAELARGSEEILVVDDRRDLLRLIETSLSGLGYRLRLAESSGEAVETVRSRVPDLALVDVMLAEGTGIDLARQLHKEWPLLPIVYMSGYAAQLEREGLLTPGVNYLCKPFTLAQLAEFVRRALDRAETADTVADPEAPGLSEASA